MFQIFVSVISQNNGSGCITVLSQRFAILHWTFSSCCVTERTNANIQCPNIHHPGFVTRCILG